MPELSVRVMVGRLTSARLDPLLAELALVPGLMIDSGLSTRLVPADEVEEMPVVEGKGGRLPCARGGIGSGL
jgi:hypothetical protein